MDQSPPGDSTVVGRPWFWVCPLVAGCCFAMGFGVTNRVVNLPNDEKPAQTQRFAPSYFPGDSLQNLRSIHQGDANVQVDLATRKPASPELETAVLPLGATALESSLAPQLSLPEERPWTPPTWSDPDADLVPTASSTELIPNLDPTPAPASALLAPPPEVLPPSFVAENDAQQLLPLQPLMPPSQP